MNTAQMRGLRHTWAEAQPNAQSRYSLLVNGAVKMFDLPKHQAERFARFFQNATVIEQQDDPFKMIPLRDQPRFAAGDPLAWAWGEVLTEEEKYRRASKGE
jgi:hypothetical protein